MGGGGKGEGRRATDLDEPTPMQVRIFVTNILCKTTSLYDAKSFVLFYNLFVFQE